jgi:subtilisin-like proprotein convertase family protein
MLQMFLTAQIKDNNPQGISLLHFLMKTWKIARIIRVKVRVSLYAKQTHRGGTYIALPIPDTGARRVLVCNTTLQLL